MTEHGGFRDNVARIDLSEAEMNYESIPDEDAKNIGYLRDRVSPV